MQHLAKLPLGTHIILLNTRTPDLDVVTAERCYALLPASRIILHYIRYAILPATGVIANLHFKVNSHTSESS